MAQPRGHILFSDAVLVPYLGLLSLIETLIIVRLSLGESLASVVPLFSTTSDVPSASFRLLFTIFAAVLMIVRLSVALTPVSVAAWRTCAGVHAAEALWVALEASTHSGRSPPARTFFIVAVFANAVLFTATWFVKHAREARFYAARAAAVEKKAD
jgi:hypothetical protein